MALSVTRLVRGLTYCINRYRFSSSTASKFSFDRSRDDSAVWDEKFGEVSTEYPLENEASGEMNPEDQMQEGAVMNARSVPRDWTSQRRLLQLQATRQPERPKQVVAAMLGAPNSGKSTLANALIGRKICR